MRTRKAVITIALAAAALGAPVAAAAPALAAPAAATVSHTPSVGHNVGGALLTRQSVKVGQTIDFVGTGGGRISNYRVTAVYRSGDVSYVTVWPRLQSGAGQLLLFTISK